MVYYGHYENLKEIFDLYYSEELNKEKLEDLLLDLILSSEYQTEEQEPEETLNQILNNQNEFEDFISYIVIGHLSYDLWEHISNDYKYED